MTCRRAGRAFPGPGSRAGAATPGSIVPSNETAKRKRGVIRTCSPGKDAAFREPGGVQVRRAEAEEAARAAAALVGLHEEQGEGDLEPVVIRRAGVEAQAVRTF